MGQIDSKSNICENYFGEAKLCRSFTFISEEFSNFSEKYVQEITIGLIIVIVFVLPILIWICQKLFGISNQQVCINTK